MTESSPTPTVWLREVATGELRPAILCDSIQSRHLADVDHIWKPALTILLKLSGQRHSEETSHWNWRAKMRQVRRNRQQRSFAIEYGGVTQGLMIVDLSRRCRVPPDVGQGMVYVDYVEVAPWNRPAWTPHRQFKSIGSDFLGLAVDLSFRLGFSGRIGLHSLPQADSFYRQMGLTDVELDANYGNLRYFELTALDARTSRLRELP